MAPLRSFNPLARLGIALFAAVLSGCGSNDASPAEQAKISAALNRHEDPRAHGVIPGQPHSKKGTGEATNFLEARKQRMEAAKAGQVPTGLTAPPAGSNP